MTGILMWRERFGNIYIQPWENRGRNWSDASTNQTLPKIASNYQKVGRVKDGFYSRATQTSMALLTA